MSDTHSLHADLLLKFNIENPDIEDCYAFGYECAQNDLSEAENPFKKNSMAYDYWNDGWCAGFYNETPQFALETDVDTQTQSQEIVQTITPASNDTHFNDNRYSLIQRMWEITGVLAISALVGYQFIDFVA